MTYIIDLSYYIELYISDMIAVCCTENLRHFCENHYFTPVTPNDPRLSVDPITKVEGLKLMYIHGYCGQAI